MTCTSSMLPNFVAMYTKLTEILKIIEEIMKIISIDLPKFIDLFILPTTFIQFSDLEINYQVYNSNSL